MDYTDLLAWQRAMSLVEQVYHLTQKFPEEEVFGLTTQTRCDVVSIPSDIAAGADERNLKDESLRLLWKAHGSLKKVETQLQIAIRLNYLTTADIEKAQRLCKETGKFLNGLINSLRKE